MTPFRRCTAVVVAIALTQGTLLHAAPGALISAEQVAAAQAVKPASDAHAQLHAALDRDDLAARLQAHGVSVDALRGRVDALTDAEAAELAVQIDSAPAGAGVVGVLFTIFIVLLVTDVLGLTKVFPFTRSVR